MKQGWIFFVSALFLMTAVSAESLDNVYMHNQQVSAQWVNWGPGEWEKSEAVQELAAKLLEEAGSCTAMPEHIYRWICENIAYDWDALEEETYYALLPSTVLSERRAVCEGISNLTQALFLEAGIPCIKVQGVALASGVTWEVLANSNRINHTWNEFYQEGRWRTIDCTMGILDGTVVYFDPPENLFAKTHKRLYRGDASLEHIPSSWAIPEITKAVDTGRVPLALLSDYHAPISEADWFALTGLGEGRDILLTRSMAAVLLCPAPENFAATENPYRDIGNCTEEVRQAINALYHSEIMTGWDGMFFPEEPMTRQAALAVYARLCEGEKRVCI